MMEECLREKEGSTKFENWRDLVKSTGKEKKKDN